MSKDDWGKKYRISQHSLACRFNGIYLFLNTPDKCHATFSSLKKNVHVQIITQSGRAELGMYAEDERGRLPTRCTAFIHNLRGRGGWWVGEGQQHRLSGVPDVEGWQQVGAAQCEF